jgi:hypothetical protein
LVDPVERQHREGLGNVVAVTPRGWKLLERRRPHRAAGSGSRA